MDEIWKDIEGYEGLYQVSNLGGIRSLPRINRCVDKTYIRKGKMLKGSPDKDGYLCVHLSKGGVQHKFLIHRLVANNFISNTQKYRQVNHKN